MSSGLEILPMLVKQECYDQRDHHGLLERVQWVETIGGSILEQRCSAGVFDQSSLEGLYNGAILWVVWEFWRLFSSQLNFYLKFQFLTFRPIHL